MKREQALARVQHDQFLLDVFRFERTRMEHIIDVALQHEDQALHWDQYEYLKKMASSFVGLDAPSADLRTTWHYHVMAEFIDWLLIMGERAEKKQSEENCFFSEQERKS